MLTWNDIEVRGKPASVCNFGDKCLYVCERFGAIEAWIGGQKIGIFATMHEAKEGAASRVGVRRKVDCSPYKFVAPPSAAVAHDHVADAVAPAPENADPIDPPAAAAVAAPLAGHCKCGARLGRSGRCPALCEPVPDKPPAYDGPRFVGSTHIGRLGAPVSW